MTARAAFATAGFAGLGAMLAAAFAFVQLAVADLPPTWIVLILLAVAAFAALLWAPDLRGALLALFLFTVPIEISKALSSQGLAYSPALSLYLSDLAFLPLLALWLADRMNGAPRAAWTGGHSIILLLSLWMTFSALTSIEPLAPFILLTLLKYALYALLLADLTRAEGRLRLALLALAAGLALQLVWVALQILTGSDLQIQGGKHTELGRLLIFEQGGGAHFRRPSGLLAHPNLFADYLTFLLPPLLVLVLAGRRLVRGTWLPALLLLAAGGAALLLSLSRGGWIAFAAAALFVVAGAWWARLVSARQIGALALAGLLVLAAVPVVFPQAIYRITLSDQRSTDSRIAMMDQAMVIIGRYPVAGVGLGGYNRAAQTNIPSSFSGLLPAFRETLLKGVVHNRYLLAFAETGVIGVALFLLLLLYCIRLPFRLHAAADPIRFALLLGFAGSVVAQAVFHAFDHFSHDVRIGLLFVVAGLMLGIADPVRRADRAQNARAPVDGAPGHPARQG